MLSRETQILFAIPSMRASTGLILAAFLTLGAGLPAHAEDQTLLRAREGAAAMIRGQYDKAVTLYDEALATPEIADFVEASIYSDRGVAKWRLKQTKEAIDDFNAAIQLSPENATVYNNRGNALMDLGHPDEAAKDFDRAITLSSNYGAAYNNRGNAYAALGQYDVAFGDFRKAVELMPQSPAAFNGRGKAHAELRRHNAAVRDLSRAISLDTKYAVAYRNRATAYFALAKYVEAAADATLALELEPEKPQPDLLLLRARSYASVRKYNQAVEDLNKAIELNPELVEAYVERGMTFTQVRRFEDAIGDFTRAIEIDPRNAKAYAMRAEAKQLSDPEGDALYDVNQALSLALDDPAALRIRGNIYEAQERFDEAIADYRKALAKDPAQAESRTALLRLKQEVPEIPPAQPLAEPVAGWVIEQPSPGRFMASNPDFRSLKVELEMYGSGTPKILEWKLMRGALSGIGLLRYYAGDLGQGDAVEYVAIVDTRANRVVSIEPHIWGTRPAQWNWQAVSVVVTDPDGNANEIKLRQEKVVRRSPAARDDFWGFAKPVVPREERRRARRRGGGGGGSGGNPFGWLFR
ncbi:MAG: tetratricopeptide repeat protein [Methyloceanibacter sp.]